MRRHASPLLFAVALAVAPAWASAEDAYKIEPLKDAPPAALAGPVKSALEGTGFRVLNPDGKPLAEFWLRKGIPASGKPSGVKGSVLFPVLAEGELLGVVRYLEEGQDYRDQAVSPGVYTLRYGLQPVNGAHLGVSTYRDYALLSPAGKDAALATLPAKKLEELSAQASGTTHPSVLLMLAAPGSAQSGPKIVHDEALNTWGAVLPLDLAVKGEAGAVALPVQVIVSGAKMD